MAREPLPTADGAEVAPGDGDWERAGLAERLSAAGSAVAAMDVILAGRTSVDQPGEARVNPPGHVWVSAVSAAMHGKRLEELWERWRDGAVNAEEDGVTREDLDPWQRFAHDIALLKADERERRMRQRDLRAYQLLRLLTSGPAGTGKSRTVRAIVRSWRRVVQDQGGDKETVKRSCALAAPTGCASFHMRYGASTMHTLFGLGIGYCGPLSSASKRLPVLKERLKRARVGIFDEFSMIGRIFMGKALYRAQQILGARPPAFRRDVSMGGLDVIMAGHSAQAQPIGDERLYKMGAYAGRGVNKPRRGQVATGAPSCEGFANAASLFFKEFEDVAVLRSVWRPDDGNGEMSPEERTAYRAEADKFLEVTGRMADLEWTPQDHAWLQRRSRSALGTAEA